ncbi:MAG: MFS transporter [Chroococcales cyanobacterium]
MKFIRKKNSNGLRETSATQHIFFERAKAIALGAMCLAIFTVNLDGAVVDLALPQIQTSLGATMLGLQWILNAYMLPIASLLLASGTLGDIYGRKRVLAVGLAMFTLASILCGLAPNLIILIIGRSLQGIGAAAIIALSLTILSDTFPDTHVKTQAIGIWSAVSALALVAGPIVGGLLIDWLGWRSMFFLNVPFGAIAYQITLSLMEPHNPNPSQKQPIDWSGLVFSAIFLASLTYALTEGSGGSLSPQVLSLLGVAALSFIAFLIVELKSISPMIPLNLWNLPFATINLIPILIFFTFSSLVFLFSLFLQQVQGYSATAVGAFFLPMNGAAILASLVCGWFVARFGWRFPVILGLVLASIATFSLIQVNTNTAYGEIVLGLIGCGFGGGLTIAPLAGAVINFVPSSQEGIASAILNIGINLGGVLGIALQGAILTQSLTFQLTRSLSDWNLTSNLEQKLITDALHNSTNVPSDLPVGISASVWHSLFNEAFISGLHTAVLIASVALLTGALLIVVFVPQSFKIRTGHSQK